MPRQKPTNNFKRLILAASISLICGHPLAQNSAIDAMWYSSAGATNNGANGMGIQGPTATLKTPNKTFQVSYFDPPRFTAGCSGISMALGGFEMLSSAQLETMVRAIMQAAPGYLMELAIKAMCDDCAHIMQSMHALATAVNSGQINSCRVAEGVINAAVAGTPLAGENDKNLEGPKGTIESQTAAAQGYFSGVWGAMNNLFSGGPKANTGAYQCDSTDYGNTLIDTFYSVNPTISTAIDPTVFGGEQTMMQIIQSLVGTTLVHTTGQSPTGGSTPCNAPDTTQTTSNNNGTTALGIPIVPSTASTTLDGGKPGMIDFGDIVNGSSSETGANKQYYVCGTFASGDPYTCQDAAAGPFKFQGLKNYILTQFAGDQGSDANGNPNTVLNIIQSGSILDSFQNGNALTPAQQSLIQQTPINFQKLLVELQQQDQYVQMAIYDQAFQIFSESLAASIAMSVVNTTKTIYASTLTGKRVVPLSATQTWNLEKLLKDAKGKLDSTDRAKKLHILVQAINDAKVFSWGGTSS